MPQERKGLPSVWGVIAARNEADIIEANLRHHLELGLTGIILLDNMSNDGTGDIARLVPGVHVFDDTAAYDQHLQNCRMTELAMGFGAEWVLTIDADEFWYPTRSDSIPQAIVAVGRDKFRVPGHTHTCSAWDDASLADPTRRIRWRSTSRIGNPKVGFRCAPGRRAVDGNERCSDCGIRPATQHDLWLRHYPVRGAAHFARKLEGYAETGFPENFRHLMKWHRTLRSNPDGFNRFFFRKCVFGQTKLGRTPWKWAENPLATGQRSCDPRKLDAIRMKLKPKVRPKMTRLQRRRRRK